MSVKNLFNKSKPVSSTNLQTEFREVESAENFHQQILKKDTFVPTIDYTSASNFAFFGSAEEYYKSAFSNILNRYPYDGSSKEVAEFLNNSSYLDLYIFENKYPRNNGYVTISSNGWGSLVGSQIQGYGKPSTLEYISLVGGPNTASEGMEVEPLSKTFDYSNKYDTNIYENAGVLANGRVGSRESNLKTDFDNGVTVEFWLKKAAFDTSKTEREVIFDLWNGEASSSSGYGRIILGIQEDLGNPDESVILVLQSGTTAIYNSPVTGFPVTTVADGNWHHYAFSFANTGSNLDINFYLDGSKVYSNSSLSSLGEITGSLKATIGALQTCPPGVAFHGQNCVGSAKFSGSIDEFRFWKSQRDQEQIVDNRWVQVGGGSNTDISNAELGVYYKFNEGITGNSAYDSVVLDYSGRITNGTWINYPGSSARSTGSAMVESGLAEREYKDPVIYDIGTSYQTAYNDLLQKGLEHDYLNTSQLYKTFPSWIIEEDENASQEMKKLTQIISSFFDTMHILIGESNKIKDASYQYQTPLSESILGQKPFPHNQRLLESYGLSADELFQNQTFLEFIQNRSKETQFDYDLTEVKNEIYRNIYNNLVFIYKSKGTEKSIRNMLRSIGINEEILKLNAYTSNNEFLIENTYSDDTFAKKYINFHDPDHFSATIFQSASANPNTNSRNYISGAINQYQSFTSEVNVIFPARLEANSGDYFETNFTQSSIFGLHITQNTGNFDWPSVAAQDTNFELYAITPEANSDQCYFLLKSRDGTVQATSSLYKDVYKNSEWTFGVRIYNDKYPNNSSTIAGTTDVDYKLDFVGYNTEGTFIRNQFKQTISLTDSFGSSLVTSNKRYYVGANRTNFTGSVQNYSDVKVGFVRHFDTFVEDEAIKVHSIDRTNFGVLYPQDNEFLLNSTQGLNTSYVPRILFNTINVDFETVTGSDSSGKFLAVDFSSGSISQGSRYPDIGTTLYTQHEFTGYGFKQSSTDVVSKQIVVGSNLNLPEAVNSSDLVNIVNRDDELFTRDNSIIGFNFALEKSYYGVISKDILDFFGGVVAFNNLIGDVSNKYKLNYDKLEFLRTNFFEKITSLSTLERFYGFYKWIDDAIAKFITQLVPAAANFEDNIRDLIESHILERNKIKHVYPMFDYYGNTRFAETVFEAAIKGSKNLRREWLYTSPPFISGSLLTDQSYRTKWWKDYANRTANPLSSGNSLVDSQRERYRIVKGLFTPDDYIRLKTESGTRYTFLPENSPGLPNTLDMDVVPDKSNGTLNSSGGNTKFNKNIGTFKNLVQKLTKTGTPTLIVQPPSGEVLNKDKLDIRRNIKRKHEVTSYSVTGSTVTDSFYISGDSEKIIPFTFMSKSVSDGYASGVTTAEVNNIHFDSTYNDLSVPLQGPFTEIHVGGNQHRHQGLQTSPTAARAEAFKIFPTANGFQIKGPQGVQGSNTPDTSQPFAIYTRDGVAKRPFNITNIKNTSTVIGNFAKENEFVFTNSRTGNNRAFVKAEGFSTGSTISGYINNFYDMAKPNRDILSGSIYGDKTSGYSSHVIVNRFSAPGGPETAGDNQGGPGLDYQAAEFSPYNNINYRNLTVRNPLRTFLSSRMEQFGIASGSTLSSLDYNNTASFHKQHRNGRSIVTQNNSNDFSVANSSSLKTRYDNAYVETPIPGDETQYSWITASAVSSTIIGYQDQDGYDYTNGTLVEQLNFVSSSDVVTYISGGVFYGATYAQASNVRKIVSDVVGLNINIIDPIFVDGYNRRGLLLTDSQTGYVNPLCTITNFGKATILNNLLLNRNGAYGYTSFKQIRVGQSKLAKGLRKLNLFTFNPEIGVEKSISTTSGSSIFTNTYKERYGDLVTFKESPVVSKYNSIEFILSSVNPDKQIRRFEVQANHGNNLTFFTNQTANELLKLNNKIKTPAMSVIKFYKNSKNIGALEMSYSETILPKEINTYLKFVRQRQTFDNNFWRDNKNDRQDKGILKKNISATRPTIGYRRSSWDLDIYPEFNELNFDNYPNPSILPAAELYYDRPGILQNFTTFNKWYSYKLSGVRYEGYSSASALNIQPTYARPQVEYQYNSIVSPFGMDIYDAGSNNLRTDVAYNLYSTGSLVGSGFAKWETGENAEKYITSDISGTIQVTYVATSSTPFYDSYDEYSEDIRTVGKDMTVLPEFRISEFTEKMLNENTNIYDLPDFLKMTQCEDSEIPNDSTENNFFEIYSATDFLKYFEIVRDNNEQFLVPDSLALKCKVIKKFLPYNGFYPSERTVEISQKFFENYGEYIKTNATSSDITDANKARPVLQTLFAPGIMYNTIKSGIAVDYPIYTASYNTGSRFMDSASSVSYKGLIQDFSTRIPFDALYDPASYLNGLTIYDNEASDETKIGPTNTTRLYNDLTIANTKNTYIYAINNFLSECVNFFLEEGQTSQILSKPEEEFGSAFPGLHYGMRVKMWRSKDTPHPVSGTWGNYPVPQDTAYLGTAQTYYIFLNQFLFNGYDVPYKYKNAPPLVDCSDGKIYIERNLALTNFTCSITLSGALGQYTTVGTSSAYAGASFGAGRYTGTTFSIDNDIGASITDSSKDNALNTALALINSINSGPSSAEFIASLHSEELIINVEGDSAFKFPYLKRVGTNYVCIMPELIPTPFTIIKVDVKNPFINAKLAISNSVGIDQTVYTNEVINQFFIKDDIVPFSLDSTDFVNNTTSSFGSSPTGSLTYPKETLTMYSRPTAFGPAVLAVTGNSAPTSSFANAQDSGRGINFAFTPPYYYGESWYDIVYIAQDTNENASVATSSARSTPFRPKLDDAVDRSIFRIINSGSNYSELNGGTVVKEIRFDSTAGSNPGTDLMMKDGKVNQNAMQLGSSLFPFEKITDSSGNTRWAIKTKFETPILNFNHLNTSEDVFYPTGAPSASVPRGMWHQFGRIPQEEEGVFIQVSPIPTNWRQNSSIATGDTIYNQEVFGDLASLCGFNNAPVRVGKIADFKTIKEAVVAIPFLEVEGERQFFNVDRFQAAYIKQAIEFVESKAGTIKDLEDFIFKAENVKLENIPHGNASNIDKALASTSITDMFIKMRTYILPPVFDYMSFNINPIAMYIFDFEYTFDKNDLAYIWQNIMPKPNNAFEYAESIIAHPLLSDELLGDFTKQNGDTPVPTNMPENLKWMVFKIKQRGLKDYKKFMNKGTLLDSREEKLSYNWPYDYFSIVELAKLDAEVTFTPTRTTAVPSNSIQITGRQPINLSKRGPTTLISSRLGREDLTEETTKSIAEIASKVVATSLDTTSVSLSKELPVTIEDKSQAPVVSSMNQVGLPDRGLVQGPRGGQAGQNFSNELTRLK